MVRQRARNHIQRGLLRRVFLRQSLIGYTGIVPKYVEKGGFFAGLVSDTGDSFTGKCIKRNTLVTDIKEKMEEKI